MDDIVEYTDEHYYIETDSKIRLDICNLIVKHSRKVRHSHNIYSAIIFSKK